MRLFAFATLLFVFAGCAAPADTEPATDDVVAEPPAEIASVVIEGNLTFAEAAYTFDGSLGHQAAACAMVACYGVGYGDWDNADEVTGIKSASLTISWDGINELAFGVASYCDGPCDFEAYTMGTSPLTLDVSNLDHEEEYIFVAWHPYQSVVGGVGAQGGTETPFTVEGTVLQLV